MISWERPNRRYISRGLVVPGTKKDDRLRGAICVDTSGSCYHWLPEFRGQLEIIKKTIKFDKLIFITQSANATEAIDITNVPIPDKWKSDGGTFFAPAFTEAAKWDINFLVYLTDGDNADTQALSEVKNKFDTMWLYTQKGKIPPFGIGVFMGDAKDTK